MARDEALTISGSDRWALSGGPKTSLPVASKTDANPRGGHRSCLRAPANPTCTGDFALLVNTTEYVGTRMALTLKVECKVRRRSSKQAIETSVSDSGPGVAAEVTDIIFEPFVTSKFFGMGMGLSIRDNRISWRRLRMVREVRSEAMPPLGSASTRAALAASSMRFARSTTSAACSAAMSSGRSSGVVVTGPIIPHRRGRRATQPQGESIGRSP
jgi:hypothetical protein